MSAWFLDSELSTCFLVIIGYVIMAALIIIRILEGVFT